MSPRHRHVRVILTAGVLETIDPEQTKRVEADGTLQKPFEASVLVAAVRSLAEAAAADRRANGPDSAGPTGKSAKAPAAPFVAVVDAEQVRAAVVVALDASMESMAGEITRRVLTALQEKKSVDASAPRPPAPEESPLPSLPPGEHVRRVSTLRHRSNSILGLDEK